MLISQKLLCLLCHAKVGIKRAVEEKYMSVFSGIHLLDIIGIASLVVVVFLIGRFIKRLFTDNS